jgi:hypothetical protein
MIIPGPIRKRYPDLPLERLAEIGISEVTHWIWIQTVQPIQDPDNIAIRETVLLPKSIDGIDWEILREDLPPATWERDIFRSKWKGYHYEAIGLLRYFNRHGHRFTAPQVGPPGVPPTWTDREKGIEEPSVVAALWWQRAYRPTTPSRLAWRYSPTSWSSCHHVVTTRATPGLGASRLVPVPVVQYGQHP